MKDYHCILVISILIMVTLLTEIHSFQSQQAKHNSKWHNLQTKNNRNLATRSRKRYGSDVLESLMVSKDLDLEGNLVPLPLTARCGARMVVRPPTESDELVGSEKAAELCYVVELETGEVAGVGFMIEDGNSSRANAKVTVRIAIDKEHQGKGAGHELLNQLISEQLNLGSRFTSIVTNTANENEEAFFASHGFVKVAPGVMAGQPQKAIEEYEKAVEKTPGNPILQNILGRLYHSVGNLDKSVEAYTQALQISPGNSAYFRNLGSAYHSQGSDQMAFASYQQAIQHNQEDWLTYFKLGLLYESLAVGKWEGATEHAIKCFQFYVNNTQTVDTDVLTRLGNLHLKRLELSEAIAVYTQALEQDDTLANIWTNLATAQNKLGEKESTVASLERAVQLDPSLVAPKHLLASLKGDDSVTDADISYVSELFDFYADFYEDHARKKLIYTAPRILRQELREMYNASFLALPEEEKEKYNNDVLGKLNRSMNVLDLGCGTGLSGAWFIDYSKTLTGVDVSSKMVEKSKSKGIFKNVFQMDGEQYMSTVCEEGFHDLIIAADVFGYVGDLKPTFKAANRALSKGGHLAFTVEKLTRESTKGFGLEESARFGYERSYLEQIAQDCGFSICLLKDYSPLVEYNQPVPGYLVILQKQ